MTEVVTKLIRATANLVNLTATRQAFSVEKSLMAASCVCKFKATVANVRHE